MFIADVFSKAHELSYRDYEESIKVFIRRAHNRLDSKRHLIKKAVEKESANK